jgi:hypothetical protein
MAFRTCCIHKLYPSIRLTTDKNHGKPQSWWPKSTGQSAFRRFVRRVTSIHDWPADNRSFSTKATTEFFEHPVGINVLFKCFQRQIRVNVKENLYKNVPTSISYGRYREKSHNQISVVEEHRTLRHLNNGSNNMVLHKI